MTAIRPTAFAGSFYPADKVELARQLALYFEQAQGRNGAPHAMPKALIAPAVPEALIAPAAPKALIAPHAGYVYSGPVAASAYALLAPARGRIRRVVLMGPSHRVAFRGIALSTATAWTTPLGHIPIDQEACRRLLSLPMVGALDKAHAQEHSLEVHLPFLQAALGEFSLVPLVTGETPADVVAAVLDELWGGPETLIVISTDLSHYLDYDACRDIDAATSAAVEQLDGAIIGSAQACGRVPVGGLLLAAKRRGMACTTLDVRNSGDTAGPRDRVVGYGAWALYEPEIADHDAAIADGEAAIADGEAAIRALGPTLLKLARAAIQAGLASGRPASVKTDPGPLTEPGAVFVTLKRAGQLRGCIGSPTAWRGLAEDIVDNAFKAAFKDPRFPPLTRDELEGLDLAVSVLTPPTALSFTGQDDLLAQLRPRIDGLIIEDSGRRALFLPSVWEQLPDKQAFLRHLKAKAGLAADHWSPNFAASRFQAVEVK